MDGFDVSFLFPFNDLTIRRHICSFREEDLAKNKTKSKIKKSSRKESGIRGVEMLGEEEKLEESQRATGSVRFGSMGTGTFNCVASLQKVESKNL